MCMSHPSRFLTYNRCIFRSLIQTRSGTILPHQVHCEDRRRFIRDVIRSPCLQQVMIFELCQMCSQCSIICDEQALSAQPVQLPKCHTCRRDFSTVRSLQYHHAALPIVSCLCQATARCICWCLICSSQLMPIARDVTLLSIPSSYPTFHHILTHIDTT